MMERTIYTTRFVVSLTKEQKAHLESRALHEQVSYSDYLRWLIASDMKKQQAREKRHANHSKPNS